MLDVETRHESMDDNRMEPALLHLHLLTRTEMKTFIL